MIKKIILFILIFSSIANAQRIIRGDSVTVNGKLLLLDSLRVTSKAEFKDTLLAKGKVIVEDSLKAQGKAVFESDVSLEDTVTIESGGALITPSLKFTTSPGSGYIMKSDADGNASWVSLSVVDAADSSAWDGHTMDNDDFFDGAVKYVGTGMEFTTITASLAAFGTMSESSQGLLVILPGTYAIDNITMPNWVNIYGMGNVILNSTSTGTNYGFEFAADTLSIDNVKFTGTNPFSISSGKVSLRNVDFDLSTVIGNQINLAGGEVNAVDSDIKFATIDTFYIAGSGVINWHGDIVQARADIGGNGDVTFDVGKWYGAGSNNTIVAKDTVDLHIRIRETFTNTSGGVELYSGRTFLQAYDSSEVWITGNEIRGSIVADDSSTIWCYDMTATSGRCRFGTNDTTATFTMKNVYSYFDYDDDIAGEHNVESFTGGNWDIDGCTFIFSGFSGDYNTLGSPIAFSIESIVRITNSRIIDIKNDNGTTQNYFSAFYATQNLTMSNCIVEQKDSDYNGGSSLLSCTMSNTDTLAWNIINTTFVADDSVRPIYITEDTRAVASYDVLKISGCTFQCNYIETYPFYFSSIGDTRELQKAQFEAVYDGGSLTDVSENAEFSNNVYIYNDLIVDSVGTIGRVDGDKIRTQGMGDFKVGFPATQTPRLIYALNGGAKFEVDSGETVDIDCTFLYTLLNTHEVAMADIYFHIGWSSEDEYGSMFQFKFWQMDDGSTADMLKFECVDSLVNNAGSFQPNSDNFSISTGNTGFTISYENDDTDNEYLFVQFINALNFDPSITVTTQ